MPTVSGILGMTLPESFDKVDVAVLSENFSKIDAEFAKRQIANNITTIDEGSVLDARQGFVLATLINKRATSQTYSGVFTIADWAGTEEPFTQTIDIKGLLATDNPIVDVDMSTATDPANKIENWNYIYRLETLDGKLKAYAAQKPTVQVGVILKVIR